MVCKRRQTAADGGRWRQTAAGRPQSHLGACRQSCLRRWPSSQAEPRLRKVQSRVIFRRVPRPRRPGRNQCLSWHQEAVAVHTVRMKSRLSELRSLDLFGGLTDQQLSELVAGSTEISVRPGLELFREGEHADFWWVLLDGVVDLVRYVGREETIVAKMDVPGRWAGGFRAWDDQGVYLATGRAATTGRVLRIPAEVLRERVSAWFPLGGISSRGSTGPRVPSRRPHGSASPLSPSARSPPAWRMRSTIRPRPPFARSMPWRMRARRCWHR